MSAADDDDFMECLGVVLDIEGGAVDHADDPGGFTVKGVTLALLRALGLDVDGDGQVDAADLAAMTEADRADLYRREFWDACRCGDLPAGVDLAMFDCAVNQGPPTAARLLQGAAGVRVDGQLGPATLAAARRAGRRLLLDFMVARAVRYFRSPKVLVFGKGWARRALAIYAAARDRARGAPATIDW